MQNWKVPLLGEFAKISIMKIDKRKLFVPSKSVCNTVREDGRIATQTFLESKSNDLKITDSQDLVNGYFSKVHMTLAEKLIYKRLNFFHLLVKINKFQNAIGLRRMIKKAWFRYGMTFTLSVEHFCVTLT